MSRSKFTVEEKLQILAWIDEGHGVTAAVARFGVVPSTIQQWRIKRATGTIALTKQSRCSMDLKMRAIQAYLAGEGSLDCICIKYGIRSRSQLWRWVLKYTRGEELKSSSGGNSRAMSKGRKTTSAERLEIAQYCIAHDRNYQEAAELYQVSYQQVYSWVRKYEDGGENALVDRRGKAKEEFALTEVDRLKIEIRRLQKANYRLELENELLRKLEELEKRYR